MNSHSGADTVTGLLTVAGKVERVIKNHGNFAEVETVILCNAQIEIQVMYLTHGVQPKIPNFFFMKFVACLDLSKVVFSTKASIKTRLRKVYRNFLAFALKYGFCKKLLLSECNSDQLNIS
jgi:hypothetical protein